MLKFLWRASLYLHMVLFVWIKRKEQWKNILEKWEDAWMEKKQSLFDNWMHVKYSLKRRLDVNCHLFN